MVRIALFSLFPNSVVIFFQCPPKRPGEIDKRRSSRAMAPNTPPLNSLILKLDIIGSRHLIRASVKQKSTCFIWCLLVSLAYGPFPRFSWARTIVSGQPNG